MKKILLLCAAIAIVSIIVVACKKEASSARNDNAFDAKAVKEWYYAAFKGSPEWSGSSLKGKKLPDWKHPVTGKVGNNEAIEFPLVEKTTSFSVPVMAGNKTLTAAERTRIAEASLSKIVFIKKTDGSILVREVDYIPDWEYLQNKNFDISSVSLVDPGNGFSGLVVVKHWNGTAISRSVFENGKLTRKSEIKKDNGNKTNLTEDMECHDVEFCIWQQDCDIDIDGDQITVTCGEWYNTGSCWTEQECQYVGSPCEMYGIGCDEGNGDEENGEEEVTKYCDLEWTVYYVPQALGGGAVLSVDRFYAKIKPNHPENNRFTGGTHLNNRLVACDGGNFSCSTWGVTVNSATQATAVCGGHIDFVNGAPSLIIDKSNTVTFGSLSWL